MDKKKLITQDLGKKIKKFVESNGFDLDTFNNLISKKVKGNKSGTQAYELKQFLISNGLYQEDELLELDIDTSNIKDTTLKNFFILKFSRRKLNQNETIKDVIKYTHKKVPAILDLYFNKTTKEYIRDSYFEEKNITSKDFSQFCFGTSDGSNVGSKAYHIKQKLLQDGILPHITIKK